MKQQADAQNSDLQVAQEILLLTAEQELDRLKLKYRRMFNIANQYWMECDCDDSCEICAKFIYERNETRHL